MRSDSLIGMGGVYLYLYTLLESRVVSVYSPMSCLVVSKLDLC
jgi:hypothetical protein